MRASYYAQAFHDLALSGKIGEETLVKQFVATVAANGHKHLLLQIVRSLERIMRREAKKETIEVFSTKELSQSEVGALLKNEPFKHALSAKHKKVLGKTDDTLVGGVVVRTSREKVDTSHKRALMDLYQSLVSG
ncbi:MAG: hypothetical protein A3C93_05880 [Candidatus Lloydbacteria bacterium RIFCSPHIGHO2_02_FULL_54_17]|uniref:Uncharacterized protein n=1 Tax=Candidatus Lloydbacteria bacterium RIFCSPHIGHO2_02_FULL_54_17 TaxID=1798664 RepID=A0A1G2DG63_9BACT|nr:MAG: hypothetical protein A2762_02360 [Candidatus Lloydbacteria bacterium RIFCSPHIGHO2_01_FULL_54_11]OGZ11941.1 MAG: hypothetical protein A3C93_05880 [Candidatus Lloydbacteria bacterium RIFCSPHIGHO2_02_FULL_54_17]OGZ14195.1 MAG: hypothetical protein A2948_02570 [Candidatus Lloydbacteria bacterium RIFCSPLOWO2_01_FULL_54_18]OGZ15085.1 MAG: hypothetical protein A3H76_06700 [Candidatus Lloydbacteria bacterium RIFCSPLOWO2_02_FULL_54_12]